LTFLVKMDKQLTEAEKYNLAKLNYYKAQDALTKAIYSENWTNYINHSRAEPRKNASYKHCQKIETKDRNFVREICSYLLHHIDLHDNVRKILVRELNKIRARIVDQAAFPEEDTVHWLRAMEDLFAPENMNMRRDANLEATYTRRYRLLQALFAYVRAIRVRFLTALEHPDPSALLADDYERRREYEDRQEQEIAEYRRRGDELQRQVPVNVRGKLDFIEKYRATGEPNLLQVLPTDTFRSILKLALGLRVDSADDDVDDRDWPAPNFPSKPKTPLPMSKKRKGRSRQDENTVKRSRLEPAESSSSSDEDEDEDERQTAENASESDDAVPRRTHKRGNNELDSSSDEALDSDMIKRTYTRKIMLEKCRNYLRKTLKPRERSLHQVRSRDAVMSTSGIEVQWDRFDADNEPHELPQFPEHLRSSLPHDPVDATSLDEAANDKADEGKGAAILQENPDEDSDDEDVVAGACFRTGPASGANFSLASYGGVGVADARNQQPILGAAAAAPPTSNDDGDKQTHDDEDEADSAQGDSKSSSSESELPSTPGDDDASGDDADSAQGDYESSSWGEDSPQTPGSVINVDKVHNLSTRKGGWLFFDSGRVKVEDENEKAEPDAAPAASVQPNPSEAPQASADADQDRVKAEPDAAPAASVQPNPSEAPQAGSDANNPLVIDDDDEPSNS
jgi:hypothetical protein